MKWFAASQNKRWNQKRCCIEKEEKEEEGGQIKPNMRVTGFSDTMKKDLL